VLGRAVQERLAAFVRAGGRLLLHGVLPVLDDDGRPCTVLTDALGLAPGSRVEGTPHHFPSVRATAWAGEQPEVRVGVLQHLEATGSTDVETLVADVADGSAVAVRVQVPGGGAALVLACDYPCHLDLWRSLLGRLDVRRRVVTSGDVPGLVVATTADASGQRLLHVLNVAPMPQTFTVDLDGVPLTDGTPVHLPARAGLMLPVDVRLEGGVLRWATTELDGAADGAEVLLRRLDRPFSALLETDREVDADGDATVVATETGWRLSWPGGGDGPVRVRLT
jgi:beta-galactosidase